MLIFIAIIIFLIFYRLKSDPESVSASTNLFLILFVFLSILLRLAYVSRAIFPLYFDSAQHYVLIKGILENDKSWIFNWLSANYYHLGFHFLAAFFVYIFHVEITQVVLILGQIILALIPFPLFFWVRHETKSNMAGWLTVILAAFGWYMPAHAVDWGKYPALMSLGLISFVLSLAYLISQKKSGMPARDRWILYGILGMCILLSVFTHSRSLIVFGIVFIAWVIAMWWEKLPQKQKFVVFMAVVVITLLEIVFIQRKSILILLFDPYLQKGILITAVVLLLSIFAWMVYPRLTFVSVLVVTFLLVSLFIPVTWIPGYRDLTLLDRPYVEMVLFMPLSLLGGLGLAGLEKKVQGRFSWSRHIGLLVMGIVVINAFFTYDLYPSDCCVIVGNDDVVAMDWMSNQLPVDARIGISSTELKVMASESSEGDVGADAGIWITPLTGRATFPLPYNSNFDERATWEGLCELEIDYLYVGEAGYPFNADMIGSHPEWYRPLLSMPKTRVYEVVGCE
jgi:hypothetical protein